MAEMQRARLIPVSGIGSELEAEQRATSALLAVVSIVRDFSNALLDPLGAPRGKRAIVDTFTEINGAADAAGDLGQRDALVVVPACEQVTVCEFGSASAGHGEMIGGGGGD